MQLCEYCMFKALSQDKIPTHISKTITSIQMLQTHVNMELKYSMMFECDKIMLSMLQILGIVDRIKSNEV